MILKSFIRIIQQHFAHYSFFFIKEYHKFYMFIVTFIM